MGGLCGWVGEAPAARLQSMLAAIDYRGDRHDTHHEAGFALGVRWHRRHGEGGVHADGPVRAACAGQLAPAVPSPAAALSQRLARGEAGLADLDGAFAAAHWDGETLTLIRDPFGIKPLYFVEHGGHLYFASELKQLLAIEDLPAELNAPALHRYLTFSFVAGDEVPIAGVRRLLPGHAARWRRGRLSVEPWMLVREEIDPALSDPKAATRLVRRRAREAVRRRLGRNERVGLYLSGGVDSSGVAHWLRDAGARVRALSLDFGATSVEREQAETVARELEMPLDWIPVRGEDLAPVLMDLVWKLDIPFGDPVTGPHYMLGRAAKERGLGVIFNGEGGDQLFGGWTSKPMLAAAVYAGVLEDDRSREQQYLASYHRFYGREEQLYTAELASRVGSPGQRRALLAPLLHGDRADLFLNRVRLADLFLKGTQNILPRAERMAAAWGLEVRAPLFDRFLAEASFRIPPELKLHGACEKYVLKRALSRALPEEIVWRRKFGMSVPITDWLLGPLAGLVGELLGPRSLRSRGLFREEYVGRLRRGENDPGETRRRRIGERLWTLLMLEAWLRVFVDGRGRRPGVAAA